MINDAAPSEAVIAIKGLEAFEKAADGKATKIIIPSEIQSIAGLATSVSELIKKIKNKIYGVRTFFERRDSVFLLCSVDISKIWC